MARAHPVTALACVLCGALPVPAAHAAGTALLVEQEAEGRSLELERRLAALAAPEGEARLAAQRWLAQRLALADWPALSAALGRGGAELAHRMVEVLATADLGLELALLAAMEPSTAAVGRAAFLERASAFAPGPELPGSVRPELALVPEGERPAPFELDPERGVLGEVLERLARLAGPSAMLVLDPSLDEEVREREPERSRAEGVWRGAWSELLLRLCALHRVELEGHGFDPRHPGPRWVRVCKRGDQGRDSARELLFAWSLGSLRGSPPQRAAAARALAATGWGEGLAWLERRFAQDGDEAALAGLLLAAGRGAVAPNLARPSVVRALLERADRQLASAPPSAAARRFADQLARALARTGGLGPRGERLVEPLLERWNACGPRSQWLRLVVLEGWRARAGEARRVCLELLSAPDVAPALRLAALRALEPPLARPLALERGALLELWRWASARGLEHELVDLLERLGEPPLADDPEASPAARLLLLEWGLRHTERGEAAPDLARWAERVADLAASDAPEAGERLVREQLAAWRRQGLGGALEPLLARLRADAPEGEARARAARLALAAGVLAPGGQRALLAEARARDPADPGALETLALLCGGALRGEALELFLERARAPLAPETRARAIALCEDVLAARRDEAGLAALQALGGERGLGAWLERRWQRERELLRARRGVGVLERLDRALLLDGP